MDRQRVQFLLRSVYDVFLSPINLCTWGSTSDPSCKLCPKPEILEHVLFSCKVALTNGRYTWRHDQVLKAIAETIDVARRQKNQVQSKLKFIAFLRSEEKKTVTSNQRQGILSTANDWKMATDLHSQLKFLAEIAVASSHADIVL